MRDDLSFKNITFRLRDGFEDDNISQNHFQAKRCRLLDRFYAKSSKRIKIFYLENCYQDHPENHQQLTKSSGDHIVTNIVSGVILQLGGNPGDHFPDTSPRAMVVALYICTSLPFPPFAAVTRTDSAPVCKEGLNYRMFLPRTPVRTSFSSSFLCSSSSSDFPLPRSGSTQHRLVRREAARTMRIVQSCTYVFWFVISIPSSSSFPGSNYKNVIHSLAYSSSWR